MCDIKDDVLRVIDIRKVIDVNHGKILEYCDVNYLDDVVERYKDHYLLDEMCHDQFGNLLILFKNLD